MDHTIDSLSNDNKLQATQKLEKTKLFIVVHFSRKSSTNGKEICRGRGEGRSIRNIYIQGRRGQKASQHGT